MGNSRKCVVPSCGYRHDRVNPENPEQRRTLFTFPKDETLARAWVDQIPGLDYKDFKKSWHICVLHFDLYGFLSKSWSVHVERIYAHSTPSALMRKACNLKILPTLYLDDNSAEDSLFDMQILYTTSQVLLEKSASYEYYTPVQYPDAENSSYNPTDQNNSSIDYSIAPSTNLKTRSLPINIINASSLSEEVRPVVEFKTTLLDALGDLSASEQILMDIKQEMLNHPDDEPKIKFEDDLSKNLEEPTVYEELKNNANHYVSFLPKFWSIYELLIENDEMLAISKKCSVQESLFISEKNILLNKEGDANFSVAGQTLASHKVFLAKKINNIEDLLRLVEKFDSAKICQGIRTNEFDVDKEYTVYRDSLDVFRHNCCTLISDSEQCKHCLKYKK